MAYDSYRDALRIYQEQERLMKQQRAAFEGPALSLGERLATATAGFDPVTASAAWAFDPATASAALGMDHTAAMYGAGGCYGMKGAALAASLASNQDYLRDAVACHSAPIPSALERARAEAATALIKPTTYGTALSYRDAVISTAIEDARMAGIRSAAAASSLAYGASVADQLTASGMPGRLSQYTDSVRQISEARVLADIARESALGAAMSLREQTIRQAMETPSEVLRRIQAESYRESAESWIAGNQWQPAAHSIFHGIESEKAAAIDALINGWRNKPGYADAFSALATASDAMTAARGGLGSYASLVGDVRSLAFTPDFESSAQARLTAYRNAGFDTALLKPNQHALTTMLTLNGYVDPSLWQHDGHLIVPAKRPGMQARLKGLKPTRLQAKAYREVGALECYLRIFIDEQMSYFYGEDWYEARASKLVNQFKKKTEGEEPISGVAVLESANISDYIKIILDDTHWADIFSDIFSDREETKAMFDIFRGLRNALAHYHKGFSKADFVELRVYASWFEKQTEWC